MLEQLLLNIIPLLLLLAVGAFIARDGHITPHGMSKILINVTNPLVIFGAVAQMEFHGEYMFLPVITFFIASTMCLLGYFIASFIWKNNLANLVGLACVSGNTNYFAFPLVMLLLPQEWLGPYVLINLGIAISESSVAYYVAARGNFSITESLIKLVQLPPLWAGILGIIWCYLGLGLPDLFVKYWSHAISTAIFIGMMLIGVALAKVKFNQMDYRMLGVLLMMRFIIWPLTCVSVILCDKFYFHLFPEQIYVLIALIGVLPLPANSIAYAARLNLNVSYIAICVLVTTILALLYIPMMLDFFANHGLINLSLRP